MRTFDMRIRPGMPALSTGLLAWKMYNSTDAETQTLLEKLPPPERIQMRTFLDLLPTEIEQRKGASLERSREGVKYELGLSGAKN